MPKQIKQLFSDEKGIRASWNGGIACVVRAFSSKKHTTVSLFLRAVFINSRFSLGQGRDWDIMKREEEGRKEGRKRPTKEA